MRSDFSLSNKSCYRIIWDDHTYIAPFNSIQALVAPNGSTFVTRVLMLSEKFPVKIRTHKIRTLQLTLVLLIVKYEVIC